MDPVQHHHRGAADRRDVPGLLLLQRAAVRTLGEFAFFVGFGSELIFFEKNKSFSQVLHVIWTYFILKIVYKAMYSGKVSALESYYTYPGCLFSFPNQRKNLALPFPKYRQHRT